MGFAPGLHPEFGYLGSSPRSWRKAGLVISLLAVLGLAAEASGSKFLIAQHPSGSNPRNAMALAPAQISIGPIPAAENMTGDIQAPQLEAKSGCLKPSMEPVREDCTPGRAARRRPTSSMNTPPAIAAVPIGHRPDPAVLPREGAVAVVAALPAPAELPGPADAAAPSARRLQAPLPTSAPVKRAGYSSARRGTLGESNDVVLHRAYKEITALAQTLGVRVPRKWLDLAAEALE